MENTIEFRIDTQRVIAIGLLIESTKHYLTSYRIYYISTTIGGEDANKAEALLKLKSVPNITRLSGAHVFEKLRILVKVISDPTKRDFQSRTFLLHGNNHKQHVMKLIATFVAANIPLKEIAAKYGMEVETEERFGNQAIADLNGDTKTEYCIAYFPISTDEQDELVQNYIVENAPWVDTTEKLEDLCNFILMASL